MRDYSQATEGQARAERQEERREEVNTRTPGTEFKPNEFYERLIALRQTNPAAFARFGSPTLVALEDYEKAKRKAGGEKEGGRK